MILNENRILGIDPGTNILGFGVLELNGSQARVLDCNVIHLKNEVDDQSKLKEIFLQIQEIIETYHTGILSIELPFYGKNAQSMLKLGRAQGVAIAAAMVMGVKIYEFSAKRIKKAVTGNGNASKEQVADMVSRLLNYKIEVRYLDASDALATANCYSCQANSAIGPSTKAKNWKSFIKANPDKIIG